MSAPKQIVIVGGGLAGAKACEALRSEGYSGSLTLFAAEPHRPYERPPLSKGYLLGDTSIGGLELRSAEFFPENRVEYFVSYYDYYQPEAYIASSDTFIEKDSSVNDEIDRLRHAATSALLTRRDVIVVASVSCIYGLGSPEEYSARLFAARVGDTVDQRELLRRLVDLQYERNDMNLVRGKFRVRGDVLEVHPAYDETAVRIELFGDEVEAISVVDPLTGERVASLDDIVIFPNTHYATSEERLAAAASSAGGTRIETPPFPRPLLAF